MRTFFIFTKKEQPTKVIDNSFSKISFVFGLFWGLNEGLWIPVIVNFALLLILSFYSADFFTGFILLSNIFWGFLGNDLLIQKYLKKNYSPQNIVNASSEEKALLIHQTKKKK